MPCKEKSEEKTSIVRRGLLALARTAGMAVGTLKKAAGTAASKVFFIKGTSRFSNKSEPAGRRGDPRVNRDITEKETFKKAGASENRVPAVKTRKTVSARPTDNAREIKFYRKLLEKTDFELSTHRETFWQAIHNLTEKQNDRMARLNAVRLLSRIPGKNPLSILIMLTRDECENTRAEAVGALASRDNVDLAVFAGALKDKDVRVRLAAVKGIYRKNGRESIELLLDTLADEHAAVRRRAVLCLGWKRDPGTAPRIAAMLKNEDVSVRKAAAGALGSIREKSAAGLLIEAVGDEDAGVRKIAHQALEKITGRSFTEEDM